MAPPKINLRDIRKVQIPKTRAYVMGSPKGAGKPQLLTLDSLALKLSGRNGLISPPISVQLDKLGSARGDVLYRGASAWTVLVPGTAGQVLTTNGAGADPTWTTPSTASSNAIVLNGLSTFADSCSTGNLYVPLANSNLSTVAAVFDSAASGQYKVGVAPYDVGTGKITSAATYSTGYTEGGSGVTGVWNVFTFSSPFALTAGTLYLIFLNYFNAGDAATITMYYSADDWAYKGFQARPPAGNTRHLAKAVPGTGDVWTNETGTYAIIPTLQ